MNILAHIHGFPPDHNSGAEWMMHDVLQYLNDDHNIQVAVRDSSVNMFNGLTITVFDDSYDLLPWYEWADIVLTHLNEEGRAINIGQHKGIPIVHLIHNTNRMAQLHTNKKNMYVAYNSEWLKEYHQFNRESVVLRPPTFEADYKVEPGDKVTLINLSEAKGGKMLAEIASQMPDIAFLGVKGSYGEQHTDYPNNVTVIENTPNIKDVYRQTKILLVPSENESWGRVAIEAMCSGIPVIACPTEGLKESCGDGAVFAERKVGKWVEAIRYVLSDWHKWSRKARERFQQLDFEADLHNFNQFLEVIHDRKSKQNTKA